MTHYDVIIIGTGAGGGTLAYHLAPSGKRILLLERGDYVRREKDNWSSRAVNVEAKYHTKEVWQDKDGKPLHPHTNYYVGGNTKFYGAALFRLRKEDFGEIAHHGGISPAWPISYDELEPYYTKAEHLYQVHGERGVDPTEPWASAPYRFPPCSTSRASSNCTTTCRDNGPAAVSRAARHHAGRVEPAQEPLHPLRDLRRLPVPDPREERRAGDLRRSGARAPERDADDQREGHAPADQPVGPRSHRRGGRQRNGTARRCSRPTSSSRRAARSTRPRCCCARRTIATRTAWPTPPAWSAGTTWGT